ncbi:hypothetical protein HDV03_002706 [Kappamyces sp. JEL0829]|nr:hypothetical protein HDV03_002706 [Kappamyces sp. JEL0829]KAJ3367732.1 hypothetical protein HDU91_001137 [Kappamyces sp. JEL0680]
MVKYVKSPPMRRVLVLLLFLPIPILTYLLGRMAAGPYSRPELKVEAFEGRVLRSVHNETAWEKWAIALKTGQDVALKRTPIQLMTFLAPVRNVILIGDAPNVYVADVPMVDVISSLPPSEHEGLEMRFTPQSERLQKRQAPDQVIPDENSRGWKHDAKKNIPGFKALYSRYPDADWYIMIDDDTYVFMDNLKALLDTLDPTQPHYLGAVTNFVGCDGVTEWEDAPYFAHGGAGIVVSKATMQTVLPLLDDCIPKYDSCWAGDIRWGLCLRDAGILVKNAGLFSPDAPNDRFNFYDPCAAPRTFHHLLGSQIQKLYELEQVARQNLQRVLLTDVFKAFMTDAPQVDVDRPHGRYIKQISSITMEECKQACKTTSDCATYVHAHGDCHLKRSAPPVSKRANGIVSGLITENFNCLDRSQWH